MIVKDDPYRLDVLTTHRDWLPTSTKLLKQTPRPQSQLESSNKM